MSGNTYTPNSPGLQGAQVVVGSAAAIANSCNRPERIGRDYKCCCPICGRHSLVITHGHKLAIVIKCFHCEACGINNGFTQQIDYFVAKGVMEPTTRRHFGPKDREKYERWQAERRAEAVRIWGLPGLIRVTDDCLGGMYLRSRGLEKFIGHPALKYSCSRLVARVWHVQHGLSAIQWTYLLDEYQGVVERDKWRGRTTEGALAGGGVWLGAPQEDEWYVVAEGLETTMSAMLLLDLRCGVATLGPNFKGLHLPRNGNPHIAADNDETGIPAARFAAKVWRADGRQVRISHPSNEGWDFNNELLGR